MLEARCCIYNKLCLEIFDDSSGFSKMWHGAEVAQLRQCTDYFCLKNKGRWGLTILLDRIQITMATFEASQHSLYCTGQTETCTFLSLISPM